MAEAVETFIKLYGFHKTEHILFLCGKVSKAFTLHSHFCCEWRGWRAGRATSWGGGPWGPTWQRINCGGKTGDFNSRAAQLSESFRLVTAVGDCRILVPSAARRPQPITELHSTFQNAEQEDGAYVLQPLAVPPWRRLHIEPTSRRTVSILSLRKHRPHLGWMSAPPASCRQQKPAKTCSEHVHWRRLLRGTQRQRRHDPFGVNVESIKLPTNKEHRLVRCQVTRRCDGLHIQAHLSVGKRFLHRGPAQVTAAEQVGSRVWSIVTPVSGTPI